LRYLTFGILYVVLYLGAGLALGGHPLARSVAAAALQVLLAGAVVAAIVWRRKDWEGSHRLFWWAFGVGLALWCVGEIGFTIQSVTGGLTWVQWHTMFSLCGGIGPTVGLLAFPYRGVRKASVAATGLELVSYAMLMGFIYAYFIMLPSVVNPAGSLPQDTLLALVELQRLVLFGGLVACLWSAWETPWRQTYMRLAVGVGIGLVIRSIARSAIISAQYHEGSLYDLAWIIPYFAYLWAALDAPRSTPDGDAIPARGFWQSGAVSAIPVLAIPLIGFGLLRIAPIGEPGDSVRMLFTTLATVAGLGLLTLRLSFETGELQRSDAKVRLLAAATEQTADLILITTGNGAVEHANDACVHALGYSREELSRMRLVDLLDPDFEQVVNRIGTDVRANGIWRGTVVHRRKNGATFPAAATVVALRTPEGRVTHFVGVLRDITDELRLRDQLVHSERLSAVGELVAGVAHEINNPLQTIIGCVELLIEERPAEAPRKDLELVRQEAARAGQIVRNLLSFVRRTSSDRTVADLNGIAAATVQLREHHLAHRNIRLRTDLAPGTLSVLVNREEIQQIVLNLVLNAEHAIGEAPGTITIRTATADGRHSLTVEDDGPGVSEELRGRIFEPFFTTREVGEGTGLGLSIALGIATAHGGSLQLDAGGGKPDAGSWPLEAVLRPGARFMLTLPVHVPKAAPPRAHPPAAAPRTDRLRALVIEDELPIRNLLARLLTRRDYDVTEAASRAEAKCAAEKTTFDLVLCDVRLGDGNGGECLRDLRASHPDLGRRFVFVTGDIGALPDPEHEFGAMPVLTKPFTAIDLDRLLGEMDLVIS
jgi:PAS domain S-box-containing protein